MTYGERVEVGAAGRTAVGRRVGALSPDGIREAHDAVRAWCEENGHELAGECWEIYGHMDENAPDAFELLVGRPLSDR